MTSITRPRLTPVLILLLVALTAATRARAADTTYAIPGAVTEFTTKAGDSYKILGPAPPIVPQPAPTIFVFFLSARDALLETNYRQIGTQLAERGYLCVSVDPPAHAGDKRPDEPEGLAGWRHRIDHGDSLVPALNKKLSAILDDLVARGYTDPKRVVACGASRGGYMALHWAASEKRVQAVAAFAPVTDLMVLDEFKGADKNQLVRQLSIFNVAPKLAGRPVWIIIGDRDLRVGTAQCAEFAKLVSASAKKKNLPDKMVFSIVEEPLGHTTPAGSYEKASAWILEVMADLEKNPAPASAQDDAAAPAEDGATYAVALLAVPDRKLPVIRIVRSATGLGIKDAKDLVESAPVVIKEGLTKSQAEALAKRLRAQGAQVELQ